MEKKGELGAKEKYSSGSFTLEAAVILPLVTAFFVIILLFFRIIQIQNVVQESLIYSSRKAATMACFENSTSDLLSSELLFRRNIDNKELVENYVHNGCYGISLIDSSFSKEFITLRAKYNVEVPIGFFHLKLVEINQTSQSRKWIGMNPINNNQMEHMVYVTKFGTVYHETSLCPFLDLSIQCYNASQVSNLRNKNGHKYYQCSQCGTNNGEAKMLYVTDYGTCFHTDPGCSALKRTVYTIPFSEIGVRKKCSKCGGQ